MDARTVFDALETQNTVSDRRTAIDIAALREAVAQGTGAFARWLPGPQQPADELTKFTSNGKLSELAAGGVWSLVESESVRAEREPRATAWSSQGTQAGDSVCHRGMSPWMMPLLRRRGCVNCLATR
jgi:hypothetical protein